MTIELYHPIMLDVPLLCIGALMVLAAQAWRIHRKRRA